MPEHSKCQVFSQALCFIPFDLILFFSTCFLWCANMHTEKGFLNISFQLPSSSTVRHRNPSTNPRKKFSLCFLPYFFNLLLDTMILAFHPHWDILLFQVLTFDGRGVSGHANHVAIHNAVRYRVNFEALPSENNIYLHKSLNLKMSAFYVA